MSVAVIGIGQSMRGDDAAGLRAVHLWQRKHASTACMPEVRVIAIDAPGLDLLGALEGCATAILVDAVCSGARVGTIHCIRPDQLSAFRFASPSAHDWGVAEVLHLRAVLEPSSTDQGIRVVGIEAGNVNMGASLSPNVKAALPVACELIEGEVLMLLQR